MTVISAFQVSGIVFAYPKNRILWSYNATSRSDRWVLRKISLKPECTVIFPSSLSLFSWSMSVGEFLWILRIRRWLLARKFPLSDGCLQVYLLSSWDRHNLTCSAPWICFPCCYRTSHWACHSCRWSKDDCLGRTNWTLGQPWEGQSRRSERILRTLACSSSS